MKPYNNIEHLLDELSRIDLLIRRYLESLREKFPETVDEFRGLYVSEAEIEQILRNSRFWEQTGNITRIEKRKT